MNPLLMSVIVFACVLGGTQLGMVLRKRLPQHHLSGATKDVVRLGTGLISTIAALVLGLLIASANGTYDTQSTQIQQLTANVVVLDRILAQYGPEADFGAQSPASHGRRHGRSNLAREPFRCENDRAVPGEHNRVVVL